MRDAAGARARPRVAPRAARSPSLASPPARATRDHRRSATRRRRAPTVICAGPMKLPRPTTVGTATNGRPNRSSPPPREPVARPAIGVGRTTSGESTPGAPPPRGPASPTASGSGRSERRRERAPSDRARYRTQAGSERAAGAPGRGRPGSWREITGRRGSHHSPISRSASSTPASPAVAAEVAVPQRGLRELEVLVRVLDERRRRRREAAPRAATSGPGVAATAGRRRRRRATASGRASASGRRSARPLEQQPQRLATACSPHTTASVEATMIRWNCGNARRGGLEVDRLEVDDRVPDRAPRCRLPADHRRCRDWFQSVIWALIERVLADPRLDLGRPEDRVSAGNR